MYRGSPYRNGRRISPFRNWIRLWQSARCLASALTICSKNRLRDIRNSGWHKEGSKVLFIMNIRVRKLSWECRLYMSISGCGFVRAKGVIAIGNAAQGMIAIGIVGLGIITLAPVGVGLLFALGACVVGGIAFGSLAVGVIAGGAISVGIFTMGALAVGQFSFGALAVGQQVAIGDSAHGNIALGFSEAVGSIYEEVRAADGSFDHQAMIAAIDANVPDCFHIFANWMKAIIRAMA